MSAELQRLVDDLAERLQRSVAIDDPDVQLLAASPHHGAIDPVRMEVILSRRTPTEAVQFVRSLHLAGARSPLYRVDRVSAPVLLTAGARDLATPPEQAGMFHRALVERGKTSALVLYPQEGHGVRGHGALVDQCGRLLAFFDRHLGGPHPGDADATR